MSTLWSPCRSKNPSMAASPVFEHSFSTASRPSDRAIQKQAAAPAMALIHDRIAPCHQPRESYDSENLLHHGEASPFINLYEIVSLQDDAESP